MTLVRKDLVRPDRATFSGDDAFRFRHLSIRDAAYEGLPKSVRADLHERFARWLDECAGDLIERDEIAGFHLEQAYRYRCDLGPIDGASHPGAWQTPRRSASRQQVCRALDRRDPGAAANLLERASNLMSPDRPNVSLELNVVWVLFEGARPADAVARAQAAVEPRGRSRRRHRRAASRACQTHGCLPIGTRGQDGRPQGAHPSIAIRVRTMLVTTPRSRPLWYSTGTFEFHRGGIGADRVGASGPGHAKRAGEQYLVRHCGSAVAGDMVRPHAGFRGPRMARRTRLEGERVAGPVDRGIQGSPPLVDRPLRRGP